MISLLAHLLIPRHSNNHKAKLLHPSALSMLSFCFFLFQMAIRMFSYAPPSILGYAANISPSEIIRLTNEKRASQGLSAVTYNQALSEAAKEKAEHMLANDYWAHVAPDGTEPWYFFTKHSYKYRYAGENLARDFSNPSSAVDAWMASPSHRDNMLSSKYKEIGVAVVEGDLGGNEATIVVQLFGTQLSDSGQPVPIAQAKTEVSPTKAPAIALAISEAPIVSEAPSPTEIPTAVTNGDSSKLIPAQMESDEPTYIASLFSPYEITRTISIAVLGLLVLVTIIDAAIVAKKRVPRVSGRAFAHLAFFGMIIAVVLIVQAGKIL